MTEDKKYTYRIRVEVIGEEKEGSELGEELKTDGIECNGFVIMGDAGDGIHTAIHHVTMCDIVQMIASSKKVSAAAAIFEESRKAFLDISKLFGIDHEDGDPE